MKKGLTASTGSDQALPWAADGARRYAAFAIPRST
jgi:hypothetical protein